MSIFLWDNAPSKIFVGDTPISKVFLWDVQVRPSGWWETVQTFDFQNDWDLWWVWQTQYGTPTYTTWEWWTFGTDPNGQYQSYILPPNSVYNAETLQRFKIWVYKWVSANIVAGFAQTVWIWVSASGFNPSVIWEQGYATNSNPSIANVYNGSDHRIITSSKSWELVVEYIFNDDGSLVLSVDGTEYNLWNYATSFRTAWANQNLWINIWRWRSPNWSVYIRKVEITTA